MHTSDHECEYSINKYKHKLFLPDNLAIGTTNWREEGRKENAVIM